MCSLDLSANRIEKIEGLESLKKLEVLNLTSNRISVLENMDTLEELTHFTIANNHLEQLDNVRKSSCKIQSDIKDLHYKCYKTYVVFSLKI